MKNTIKMIGIIALVAVIGFTVVACGGGGPKSLAKEGFALQKEALAVGSGEDAAAADAYMKKYEAHQEKVKKLSPDQKKAYDEELLRLMREGN